MTGLELAREFYQACRPTLYERLPDVMPMACAGLCGEGSECFGCDDATSQDHDFSASFCLWLPQDLLASQGERIAAVFRDLPKSFRGFAADFPKHMANRRGPASIEDYYFFFTGLERSPEGWREWLSLPETQLACAVNGEVFEDNAGLFTARRADLLAYYPEDVRLKKLAARCMQMAQAGQYNLSRCLARGEHAAAMLALGRFAESALSLVFLINKAYMPFYKWAPRLGTGLPELGPELGRMLAAIGVTAVADQGNLKLVESVENFCAACAQWLYQHGISPIDDSWLWEHGPAIISRVRTPELRELDLLQDAL